MGINRKDLMIESIGSMLRDLKHGRPTRPQFDVHTAAMTAGTLATSGALADPSEPKGILATNLNHVTLKVPDFHRTPKFHQDFFGIPLRQRSSTTHIYGVGKRFFGIEQGNGQPADVNRYLWNCQL
jgi:hypothetical protein